MGFLYGALTFNKFALASQGSTNSSAISAQIAALWNGYGGPKIQRALWIEDLSRDEVIFSDQADLPLNPASNLKVLSTFAILDELGPNYRFKTQLLLSERKAEEHYAILTLKGFGDPTLTSAQLWEMVAELKSHGIQKIDTVLLDTQWYDSQDYPGRLQNRQVDSPFNAPVSALSLDGNLVQGVATAGSKVGDLAKIQWVPALPDPPIENQVVTRPGRAQILVRNFPSTETSNPRILLKGQIPPGEDSFPFSLAQGDPSYFTGLRLLSLLHEVGIQSPEQFSFGTTPQKSRVIVEKQSPPLGVILQEVNKNSNNFMAEQLLKNLGIHRHGAPGNTAQGVATLLEKMQEWNIPLEGVHLENGSGLSKNNRITARSLAQVLRRAFTDPELQVEFLSSLSVAQVDGTLRKKFSKEGLPQGFRGKTGTLNGVTSLTGYVPVQPGRRDGPYLFVFIANGEGESFWKQKEFQQKLLNILSTP